MDHPSLSWSAQGDPSPYVSTREMAFFPASRWAWALRSIRAMRSPLRLLALVPLTVVFGVIASACSGKLAPDEPSIGNGDAGALTDSGLGVRSGDCPAALPAQGTACTKNDLLCEYGDDYNPLCNTVLVCSSGRWASPIYFSGPAKCPSVPPTVPPNPSNCAATPEALPTGTCSSASNCNYDGAQCSCGVHCPNYPIRQRDCDPDAGVTTSCCDTSKVTWGCFDGPHYCKTPRPRVGSPCTTEKESCAIDAPVECGQTVIECNKGVWNLMNASCAISSAKMKRDITYVDQNQAEGLHDELMSVRLARYRYKGSDDTSHLGFIIEDMPPGSAAVLPTRDRVDLYGYVSMAVASLQKQQKELDALKTEVARLSKENAAMKRRTP